MSEPTTHDLQAARYVQVYREPGAKVSAESTPTLSPAEEALLKIEAKLDALFAACRAEVMKSLAASLAGTNTTNS
jgi:hypothetical protein